jgi:hypothetical protein
LTLSEQLCGWQVSGVPAQAALLQSAFVLQRWPVAHFGQTPPQSRSDSF